jgi:Spy/CpxP family protein refolding chaperone
MKLGKIALSITMGALMLISVQAVAQQGEGGGGGRGAGRVEALAKELNLSAKQKDAIQKIFEGMRPKMSALRKDDKMSEDDKRAKMRAMMQGTEQSINAVLTADQRNKLKAKGGLRGLMGQGRGGAQQQTRMADYLKLTPDQRVKFKSISDDWQKEVAALNADRKISLSDRDKKYKESARRHHQQILAILNADQRKKFEEVKGMNRGGRPGASGG